MNRGRSDLGSSMIFSVEGLDQSAMMQLLFAGKQIQVLVTLAGHHFGQTIRPTP